MNLQGKINMILSKFNDPDCVVTAEKEIKALIVTEIDDGEKLNLLINCLSDDKDVSNFTNKKTKYNQLKLFISIAEIFQHQILEYLPKIFSKLNKKIKDGDVDIADIISETYGGIIEFSFKGATQEDALIIFDECLSGLFKLGEKGMKSIQVIAAQSITKIIQSCQISILTERFQQIFDKVITILEMQICKAIFNFLECILSLILSIQQKVELISNQLPDILDKHIFNEDPKTRKFCVEIYYTLVAIDSENMMPFHERIYNHLQKLKRDQNKNVREAAMDCLKVINAPEKSQQKKKERIQSQRVIHRQEKNNKKRPVSKKSVMVNQKINLDHVKSQIDKKKINKNFLKQNQDDIEILVKEDQKQQEINYDEFYTNNTEQLLEFQAKEEKKKKPKKQTKKFGTIPNFQETINKSPFDQTEDFGTNFIVMTEKQKQHFQQKQEQIKQLQQPQNIIEKDQQNYQNIQQSNLINRQTPARKSNIQNQQFDQQKSQNYPMNNQNYTEEIQTLKKYIKVLNRKLKDSQNKIVNLENQNIYLSQKMTNMSNEFEQLKDLVLKQKKSVQNPFENYQQQNQMFYKPSLVQEQNSNNKWLMKNSRIEQSINDTIIDILSQRDQYQRQQELLSFMRSSEMMREFSQIDESIRNNLLKELIKQITQNLNGDILIMEYCLKWIEVFLDFGEPSKIENLKQLHSVLYLVQNSVYENTILKQVKLLLNHEHFSNNIKQTKQQTVNQFQSNQMQIHHFSEDEDDYQQENQNLNEYRSSEKEVEENLLTQLILIQFHIIKQNEFFKIRKNNKKKTILKFYQQL